MFGKIIVLAPHRDDEVLGCGGILTSSFYTCAHIHYFNTRHPLVDSNVYDQENTAVLTYLQCDSTVSKYTQVNALESYDIVQHIAEIETLLNTLKPDTLFLPFPDYNQDHRRVYEATLTATRVHDTNHYVKNILLYEQPCTVQSHRVGYDFIPHLWVPIDIEEKLKVYQLYQSQQRGHRTAEMLRSLAVVRGMQCYKPYAEAFMVVRLTGE